MEEIADLKTIKIALFLAKKGRFIVFFDQKKVKRGLFYPFAGSHWFRTWHIAKKLLYMGNVFEAGLFVGRFNGYRILICYDIENGLLRLINTATLQR